MNQPTPQTSTLRLTFDLVVQLMIRTRDTLYPWMHILHRADGTVVVTISRPPAGER